MGDIYIFLSTMKSKFVIVDYTFEMSCCDNVLVKCKDSNFKSKSGLGLFTMCLDVEFEPLIIHGACVFKNKEFGTYLYRSKYGNWVIGTVMGKIRKGAMIRS